MGWFLPTKKLRCCFKISYNKYMDVWKPEWPFTLVSDPAVSLGSAQTHNYFPRTVFHSTFPAGAGSAARPAVERPPPCAPPGLPRVQNQFLPRQSGPLSLLYTGTPPTLLPSTTWKLASSQLLLTCLAYQRCGRFSIFTDSRPRCTHQ